MSVIYMHTKLDDEELTECGNCGRVEPARMLKGISNFEERVFPNETVPAGECPDPDCGACCYLLTDDD